MNVNFSIGQRLAEIRDAKGMNQKDFSALGGVEKGTQSLYETGKRSPSAEYLARLHEHGFDVCYVITGVRSDRPIAEESASFINALMRLGDRERRAVARLVDDLAGVLSEPGSLSRVIDRDHLAAARGEISASVHSPQSLFKGRDD